MNTNLLSAGCAQLPFLETFVHLLRLHAITVGFLMFLLMGCGSLRSQPSKDTSAQTDVKREWAIQELARLGFKFNPEALSVDSGHYNSVLTEWQDLNAIREPLHILKPKHLYIFNFKNLTDLSALVSLDCLEVLWLEHCEKLDNSSAFSGLKKLRVLNLRECIGLKGKEALSGLVGLSKLEELWLGGCTGLENLSALTKLVSMRELHLDRCTGLKGPAAFQGLAGLVKLEKLYLDRCTGFEDTGVLSNCANLRDLALYSCSGLKGRAAFQGLAGLVNLENLTLDSCAGLEDTSVLAGLTRLKVLRSESCTGLKGKDALKGLLKLPNLEWIRLSGSTGLSQEDVDWLQQKRGNQCTIVWP